MNNTVDQRSTLVSSPIHDTARAHAPAQGYEALGALAASGGTAEARLDGAAQGAHTARLRRWTFDVHITRCEDTKYINRVLRELDARMPAGDYVLQEINAIGVVHTGGHPDHLEHNRTLAFCNEDRVRHYLALVDVKPERGVSTGMMNMMRTPETVVQPESTTERNLVRLEFVYRARGGVRDAGAPVLNRCAMRKHA